MKLADLTRNLAVAAFSSAAMMLTAPASAIVVGGVDFGALGTISHIETTTLQETLITGNGQNLQGYGQVNTVNSNILYAGANRLYFVFSGYTSVDFTSASSGFTGGTIDVYFGPTFDLLAQDSAANIAIITGYQPWVRLTGHAFAPNDYTLSATGTLTGAVVNFTGSGLLDADTSGAFGLAAVAAYLNPSNIPDGKGGFADINLTTSGSNLVLNPFDNTTGCQDGTAQAGQWCISGSADIRGTTVVVPEPGSIALLGLALGVLGMVGRRSKKA